MGPIVGRGTCDDAIEVLRKALGFHERFASAVGTSGEIRVIGGLAIVSRQDCFRESGGLVQGPIAEVDELLGMANGPACVGHDALGAMTIISGGDRVTTDEGRSEDQWLNRSCPSAVAALHVSAVPGIFGRQPQSKIDLRIRGWARDRCHFAMTR